MKAPALAVLANTYSPLHSSGSPAVASVVASAVAISDGGTSDQVCPSIA